MPPRRKGIYILPNLFTVAALFGGFYAIVMAMNLRFDYASVAIFAAMVLDDPQWNAQSIDAVIAGGKLQNVTLKQKVPVLLAYWTAWVDSAGVMNFRRDLYGQDAKWAAALEAPFRVRSRPLFSDEAAAGH